MKKILAYLIILLALVSSALFATSSVFSQEATDESAIDILKEKVADKVEELRQKNNKAISGFVQSNENNVIKIKTNAAEEYQVKLDPDLTKYFQIAGTTKKEIKSENIIADDYIIVTGVVTDKTISANAVFVDENFLVLIGRVSEVDKDNFSITVVTTAKEEITLDIETATKQSIVNIETVEIESTGFSKIKEGDTIHFVVKKTPEITDNTYTAKKLLLIPQEYFIK
ncbi:hypothetical protein A2970_01925 [Candidatus Roizmanbacteria bacterium RIFCSPLOWO2_01_FULL_44_13]|uniref:DUF5666 domain-containing protein n=1 Tax=Candidatus Roizmanbacteria bacterium RIFCSPLOWO2_01_FULL_44_13 TaxID=1802069 RepID=A0A1F7JBF7_9BACT|nr:MAG: hypothetical protein A2970_01925 [Candidatus Roizmanbacteria bacterium RIFCSPLOWO2_01_FULL_44_13]